jgi:divalent metal cation (Fe/Co/Zn/Cd) transporter
VHRFIGATFVALAVYVLGQAGWTLVTCDTPEESLVGIILAVASLIIMPLVAWGKFHAAKALNSAALRSEAKETLACSYLSLTLLFGLMANAAAGWWWADPVAALLMVPWLVKEGIEGLRGEDGCEPQGQGRLTAAPRSSKCFEASAPVRGRRKGRTRMF